MCRSLRITAAMTTIGFLPLVFNFCANSFRRGLRSIAVIAGKYKSLRKESGPAFDKDPLPRTEEPKDRMLGFSPA